MTRISNATSQSSLLSRQELFSQGTAFSHQQIEMNAMEANFNREASDVGNLLSMTGAAAAFRLARVGMQSFGLAKALANPLALSVETTAFRASSNLVSHLRGQTPHENIFDARGWATSFLTFGSLKAAGAASQGQSLVLGHTFQASAMVASHNFAYGLGIATQPQGSLMSQFMHAEMTNVALGAGHSLFGLMSGGSVARLERSLDLVSEASAQARSAARIRQVAREPLGQMSSVAERSLRDGEIPTNWPANIPVEWARVKGSGLYTGKKVTDTNELSEAIVEDGILPLLGEGVHTVFGYGSFPRFREMVAQDLRLWDADKKPDYVVIGNAHQMMDNVARVWNLSEAQRAELHNHVRYNRNGLREGFLAFNTDILVPGRGPVSFKISVVDEAAFFALDKNNHAVLEFSQIRLKDSIRDHLLWSRNAERAISHLENVRDEFFRRAYQRLVVGFAGNKAQEITGEDLVRSFYVYSYRVEGYRFWENGSGSWDKGSELFAKKAGLVREILLPAFRRFIQSNASNIAVYDGNQRITFEQITLENMYKVRIVNTARVQRTFSRTAYLHLNLRGLASYLLHSVPANSLSRAYYVQPSSEYGGRKYRNLVYKPGMTEKDIPPIIRLMAHPYFRRVPVLRKVALDSLHNPVYYSNLSPWINELYAKRELEGFTRVQAGALSVVFTDRNRNVLVRDENGEYAVHPDFLGGSESDYRSAGISEKTLNNFRRILKSRASAANKAKTPAEANRIAQGTLQDVFEQGIYNDMVGLNSGEYDALLGWLASSPAITRQKNLELVRQLMAFQTNTDNVYLRTGSNRVLWLISNLHLLEPEVASVVRGPMGESILAYDRTP